MKRAYSHDLVIVGGGMVGATLACALGESNLRVAVVEGRVPGAWQGEPIDNRTSAITRATERVFRNIGAWPGMVERRVAPYRAMHVWDATGSGAIHFNATEIGEPDLGHILENRVILSALHARMAAFDNIELIAPARCIECHRDADAAHLHLEGGRTLDAPLVVAADGSNSWVREQAGIVSHGWAYQQTAVVAVVRHSRPHAETAYQRFLPDGPLAFLPLFDAHLSAIVWSTSPGHAVELLALAEAPFLDALQRTFGDKLGRMASCGERGGYPLILRHADHYVEERLALVGNAAHSIHPLAGQGLNLGVLDVALLADLLQEAHAARGDLGELRLLRRYERGRKGDNLSMMYAMDGFKRLFGSEATPVRLLRNLGLNLADSVAPLKQQLMRHALGLSGELPELVRRIG